MSSSFIPTTYTCTRNLYGKSKQRFYQTAIATDQLNINFFVLTSYLSKNMCSGYHGYVKQETVLSSLNLADLDNWVTGLLILTHCWQIKVGFSRRQFFTEIKSNVLAGTDNCQYKIMWYIMFKAFSGWAIVIGLCPSSVVVRRPSSVVRRASSVVRQHLMFTL